VIFAGPDRPHLDLGLGQRHPRFTHTRRRRLDHQRRLAQHVGDLAVIPVGAAGALAGAPYQQVIDVAADPQGEVDLGLSRHGALERVGNEVDLLLVFGGRQAEERLDRRRKSFTAGAAPVDGVGQAEVHDGGPQTAAGDEIFGTA
jgi:hypothetical protein